ncbi:MAG: nitronate monooxygenase [Deltaproteobacteria bacterium]|nr:nitronate monooxygenase [Deltaproteobacteria bacterium]
MLRTRVTEILDIEYPIIGGPMAYVSGPELVSAQSNAGGLGIIASISFQTIDELREVIRKTKQLTDKPFGINVTLLPTARTINYEDYFKASIDEGVKVIETSGRSPKPYMQIMKDAGVISMHRATRTRDIQNAERAGCDIVTIIGTEAAGHPGQEEVGTFVRVPIAANAVDIPVVAAGGITDARGLVAALALGAEGVLIGTRFMCTQEARIHDNIKTWMHGLGEMDTILIQKSIMNASRVVRNEHTEKILEMENKGASLEELLPMIRGERGVNAYESGDPSEANITIGQGVGMINDTPTVKEVIDGMVNGAKEIMQRLDQIGLAD